MSIIAGIIAAMLTGMHELVLGTLLEPALAHWAAIRRERRMPQRRQFDPTALPRCLLPLIVIAEPAGERIRLRLVGTEIVNCVGFEPTGMFVDEVFGDEYARAQHQLAAHLLQVQRPVLAELSYRWGERDRQHRQMVLPFSEDDATVSQWMSIAALAPDRPLMTLNQLGTDTLRPRLTILA